MCRKGILGYQCKRTKGAFPEGASCYVYYALADSAIKQKICNIWRRTKLCNRVRIIFRHRKKANNTPVAIEFFCCKIRLAKRYKVLQPMYGLNAVLLFLHYVISKVKSLIFSYYSNCPAFYLLLNIWHKTRLAWNF